MGIIKAGRPSGRTHEHLATHAKNFEGEKRLNIRMPESQYEKLRQKCFGERISISDFIRQIILEKTQD